MGKLKDHLLVRGGLVTLAAALTLIGGTAALSGERQSTHEGGTKVITLAENLMMPAGESIDLDLVDVSRFHLISLLGTHDGGFAPVSREFVVSAEEGKVTDPVPRSRFGCSIAGGPNGGMAFCDFTPSGRIATQRVGGPFLADVSEPTLGLMLRSL